MPNRPYDLPASTATPKTPLSPLHPASPMIPDTMGRFDFYTNTQHAPNLLMPEKLGVIGSNQKSADPYLNDMNEYEFEEDDDVPDDDTEESDENQPLIAHEPNLWDGQVDSDPWDLLPQSDSEGERSNDNSNKEAGHPDDNDTGIAEDGLGWDNLDLLNDQNQNQQVRSDTIEATMDKAEVEYQPQSDPNSRLGIPPLANFMQVWGQAEPTDENIVKFFCVWEKHDVFQETDWTESMWGLLTAGLRSQTPAIAERACVLLNRALGMPHRFAAVLKMRGNERANGIRAQVFEAVIVHLRNVNGRKARWDAVRAFADLLEGSPYLRESISHVAQDWVDVVHIALLFQSTRIRRDLLKGLAFILSAGASNRLQCGELVVPIIKTLTEIATDLAARAKAERQAKERSGGMWGFHRDSPTQPHVCNEVLVELVGYACHCLKWLFMCPQNFQVASPWLIGEPTSLDTTSATMPLGPTLCVVMELMGGEAFVVQHVGLLVHHLVSSEASLVEQGAFQKLSKMLHNPLPHTGQSPGHPDEQARVKAFRAARRGYAAIELGRRGNDEGRHNVDNYYDGRQHTGSRRNSRNSGNGYHHSGYQHVKIQLDDKSTGIARAQPRH